jgi:hypothetical protein
MKQVVVTTPKPAKAIAGDNPKFDFTLNRARRD